MPKTDAEPTQTSEYSEEGLVSQEDVQEDLATEEIADSLGLEKDQAEEELIELEDGTVLINYKPTKKPSEAPEFYQNLAETLSEDVLDGISLEYLELIEIDRDSRKKRDDQYEEGLKRTGLGEKAPGGADFQGASEVSHPLLAEAVVDFAASATKELLPPNGVVKSNLKKSRETKKELLERAERKTHFLNWQLDEQIVEYRDEMEQLITQVPLGGSQFLKILYDHEYRRPRVEWVPVDQIYLPFANCSFYTASRVTEQEDLPYDRLMQRVEMGEYRDVDDLLLSEEEPEDTTKSQAAADKIEGKTPPFRNIDGIRRLYHVYAWLRLKEDPETKGERAPYIFVIDEMTEKILSLRRNWEYGDDKREKLDWLIEFPFIKWRGAFGIGLPHLIGGLSGAATGALRALLDSAHMSNSQTALKLKVGEMSGQTLNIEPGQITEVEAGAAVDDIRKLFMPLPFNPPNDTLFQLLGWLTQAGKGVVSTSEEKIQDAGNQMPVGTAQALIEQGAKVFSSIHARLHRSQAKVLQVLCRLNYWYVDEMDNQSGTKIEVRDFANNSDIRPVSDPHIFSEVQRMAQAQAVLQLSQTAKDPKLYDERALHTKVLETLKVPYIDDILPSPQGIVESNPALENVQMSMGQLAAVYPDQDHVAHLFVHFAYALDKNYGGSPVIGPVFAPKLLEHVKQHLTLHYLQSMRNKVASVAGEDIFKLHEERALSRQAQQGLAITALQVAEENQSVLAEFQPFINDLMQKVQKAKQAQLEAAVMADPTAHVYLKTEKAAMEDREKERQAKYGIELEKLSAKVEEIRAKYETDRQLEFASHGKDLAQTALNNASKEYIEELKLGAAEASEHRALAHEQELLGVQATQEAQAELRAYGLDALKQQQLQQATEVTSQAQREHEQQMAQLQHQQGLEQSQLQHQQGMQQNTQKNAQGMMQNTQKHQQGMAQQEAKSALDRMAQAAPIPGMAPAPTREGKDTEGASLDALAALKDRMPKG